MKNKCVLALFFNCFTLYSELLKESSDICNVKPNRQVTAAHIARLRHNSSEDLVETDEEFLQIVTEEYITYFENPTFDPNFDPNQTLIQEES